MIQNESNALCSITAISKNIQWLTLTVPVTTIDALQHFETG